MQGRSTPQLGEPVARSDEDVPGRLATIEYMLQQIAKKLEGIDALAERVEEINAKVDSVIGAAAVSTERAES
jgi:hypothetical protein